MFQPNRTLNPVLERLLDQCDLNVFQKFVLRFRLFMLNRFRRRKLEKALTEYAMAAGAIPPESNEVSDGIFRGNWENIWDFIWEHREEILQLIMMIISLF